MARPTKKPTKKPAKKDAKAKAPKVKPAKLKPAKLKPAKLKPAKAAAKPKQKAGRLAALPMPGSIPPPDSAPKPRLDPVASALAPYSVATGAATILDTLWQTVEARRKAGDVEHSHSARLLARGTAKVTQKLGEEAVECVIEAIQGNRQATVLESADLLYHLLVLWVDAGIRPDEVWTELARRQGISGIAEKAARPKGIVRAAQTTKLP